MGDEHIDDDGSVNDRVASVSLGRLWRRHVRASHELPIPFVASLANHLGGGPGNTNRLQQSDAIEPGLLRREPLVARDELEHVVADRRPFLGSATPQLLVHHGRDALDLDNAHGSMLASRRRRVQQSVLELCPRSIGECLARCEGCPGHRSSASSYRAQTARMASTEVRVPVAGLREHRRRLAIVTTSWELRHSQDRPRLVTAYVES